MGEHYNTQIIQQKHSPTLYESFIHGDLKKML